MTICACRRYERDVDEALEDAYQSYLKRKGKREELEAAKGEAAVSKRARLGRGSDGLGGDNSADEEDDSPATFGTAPMEDDEEVCHACHMSCVGLHAYGSESQCVLLSFYLAQTYRRAPCAHIVCKVIHSGLLPDIVRTLLHLLATESTCSVQEEAGGGLLVKLDKGKAGVPQTAAAVAARWFAQDVFADPALAEEEGVPEEAHASAAAVRATGGLTC